MNAETPFPPVVKTARPAPRPHRGDLEFLPAALEILETPPSPIRIALLWTICGLVVCALAWGWFGRIDIVAVAQGKIQPTGRVKVIQPLETGRVAGIDVENGQTVAKGQPLVLFDSGEADADVGQLKADLAAYLAEAARRRAAVSALDDRAILPIPPIEWRSGEADEIPAQTKARETEVLAGDLGRLASTIAELEAQRDQRLRERERYAATATALEQLVATLQSRVDMRASLSQSGSGSRSDVIDATQTLQEQTTTLATARGQIAESVSAAEVHSRQIEDSYRSFLAENLQKLAEAERKVDEDRQLLAKARVRQERMVLTSPIEGTVSALSITTVGQVVGAGEEVMRIVPNGQGASGAGIEIEAYVSNRDIGFVRPGQEAIVKIESLPFTRYGTIAAKLIRLAGDAIPEPDAAQREGNATKASSERGFAGAQRIQNLVFPATFQPAATTIVADGAVVPLSPGMTVTVEIKTGSRRILEYLFSPLVEIVGSSMKER